jgi:uncharacterized repeat protein (TIGR03803 family)
MNRLIAILLLSATTGIACAGFSSAALAAPKLKTLYSFKGLADGGVPVAGLTWQGGTLYGTAEAGGAIDTQNCPDGCGVVFKVDPRTGAEAAVYAFQGGSDGEAPVAGLIHENGLFYGTTSDGGPPGCFGQLGCGTVFSVNPKTGAESVLHAFTEDGTDGEIPFAGLTYLNGNLYGTTVEGGVGDGNVFAINAKTGAETELLDFEGGAYGEFPEAGLTLVGANLFGTTAGQAQNYGNVFEIDTVTGGETILHGFSGTDGAYPLAGLIYYNGLLYGTTSGGGGGHGAGEVFSINPQSGGVTVLYAFQGGTDGSSPQAGLVEVNGMLYGTTKYGGVPRGCIGNHGCGTIFEIDPGTAQETTLYHFTGKSDQGNPVAGLIYHGGSFYGTTAMNGTNSCYNQQGCGTVFKFTP